MKSLFLPLIVTCNCIFFSSDNSDISDSSDSTKMQTESKISVRIDKKPIAIASIEKGTFTLTNLTTDTILFYFILQSQCFLSVLTF